MATAFKALLIGNCTYPKDPHELPDLTGPSSDLRVLKEAFTHPELGLYRPEDVVTLLDRTRAEIMEHLEAFVSGAEPDDQLLLYYSGHGRLDNLSNLYLCASDTRTNLIVSTGISDVQINAMLTNSQSRRIVIVLDCCHSGRFKGLDLPRSLVGEGRFVLTSSRARELSQDAIHGEGPSAFTRHLADALLSAECDLDQDGFISLNELYNYVLPRVYEETKQTPQRNFDRAVADVALGRSRAHRPAAPPAAGKADERPVLAVSEESIEIKGVQAGEVLPPEVVDVFNQGGGALDWTATCDADWVKLEVATGFFTLQLAPRPGVNRARIHVRDRGAGGSKTVRVLVEVQEDAQKPRLVLSETELDFGELSAGAKVPPRVVRLSNAGGGELAPAIARAPEWLEARLFGEVIEIAPRRELGPVGPREGEIAVESRGGSAIIRVRAVVGEGPVLSVQPGRVDFGAVEPGARPTAVVTIGNAGGGALEWSHKKTGGFFSAKRDGDGLRLTLHAEEGSHQGAVLVSSNGGDVTVDVRAHVKAAQAVQPAAPPVPPQPPPPPPAPQIGPGRWQVEMNAFGVVGSQMLVDLLPNGQLAGQQTMFGFQAAIGGAWAYEPITQVLSLQLVAQMMGFQAPDFRQVMITGRYGDVLVGRDANMVQYGFRRVA